MRPPRRLKQADIELLIIAAIEGGLLDADRNLRTEGIDPALVLSLKTASNPLEQIQIDLNSLNNIDAGRNEDAALVRYLRNAASHLRIRMRDQEKTFEQYAIMLCGPDVTEELRWPPFVLTGLVDGVDVKFVPIPLTSSAKTPDRFFLSSRPVPIDNNEAARSVEIDKISLIRWLKSKRSMWPVRPPLPDEWKAALMARNRSKPILPIALPAVTDGRCFWCLEEEDLLARDYEGRVIDAGSADVWLIYELPR